MDVKHSVPKYKYKNPEIYALEKKKNYKTCFGLKKTKQQCSFYQAILL